MEQRRPVEHKVAKCLLHNWVEERAVAALDAGRDKHDIQKYGHTGIFSVNLDAKMDDATTMRTDYTPPKSPGVRTKGLRRELLERHIAQLVREEMAAEMETVIDEIEYNTTTQTDFNAQGFLPPPLQSTGEHAVDFKSEQAVTFWSENHHQIQGMTVVKDSALPFRKYAQFTTPVVERLDEPPPDI